MSRAIIAGDECGCRELLSMRACAAPRRASVGQTASVLTSIGRSWTRSLPRRTDGPRRACARAACSMVRNLPSIEHAVLAQLHPAVRAHLDAARSDARVSTLALLSDGAGLQTPTWAWSASLGATPCMNGARRAASFSGVRPDRLTRSGARRDGQGPRYGDLPSSDAAAQQFADRARTRSSSCAASGRQREQRVRRTASTMPTCPTTTWPSTCTAGAGPDAGRRLVHVAEYAAPREHRRGQRHRSAHEPTRCASSRAPCSRSPATDVYREAPRARQGRLAVFRARPAC